MNDAHSGVMARRGLIVIAIALALPLVMRPHWRIGRPVSWQGDEPHYLLMLTSLLNDGDLDLGNNYASAHRGGLDAGASMSGFPLLDHQIVWWHGDERIDWCQAFECDFRLWDRDEGGHPKPHPKAAFHTDVSQLVERPVHPVGFPLLLSLFVWPFRQTRLIEPAAVTMAWVFLVTAMVLFYLLARRWARNTTVALATTAAAFLATPVWHYSRSLYTEGFLLLATVAATWLVLEGRSVVLAGACIGLGILVKPPFGVVGIPFVVLFLAQRKPAALIGFVAPVLAGVVGTALLNWQLYGSPWRAPQSFRFGNPLEGSVGLLFDVRHGLLPFSPLLLLAIPGWRALVRRHRTDALLVLGVMAVFFGLIACWWGWDGGWCYGPRLLVPVIPFCALGLLELDLSRPWLRDTAIVLASVSVAINLAGAVMFWSVYDQHPFMLLARRVLGARAL